MYRKAKASHKVIACLSETHDVPGILRYLVDQRDFELWAHMLSTEPPRSDLKGLVDEALNQAQNDVYFSQVAKAFLDADMFDDLTDLLERSVTDIASTRNRNR